MFELNSANFDKEVKQSDTPVIVDFWASWCMPCRMMAPVFEEVSKDYEGKLKFAKVSTEECPDIATTNNIQGIPCLVVFLAGTEVDRIVGYTTKDQLKSKIDAIMDKISK